MKWTDEKTALLIEIYPETSVRDCAKIIGTTEAAIGARAHKLGLKKSPAFIQANNTRFKKGHQTWNKGMKGLNTNGTMGWFKKGNVPHTHRPIGSERTDRGGYLVRKVSDTGVKKTDWALVHRWLWEQHHGAIPEGHIVVFRDKNPRNICIDNLELISRAENVRRNHYGRYPEELRKAIGAKSRLTRILNEMNK